MVQDGEGERCGCYAQRRMRARCGGLVPRGRRGRQGGGRAWARERVALYRIVPFFPITGCSMVKKTMDVRRWFRTVRRLQPSVSVPPPAEGVGVIARSGGRRRVIATCRGNPYRSEGRRVGKR